LRVVDDRSALTKGQNKYINPLFYLIFLSNRSNLNAELVSEAGDRFVW
jgi:hypothetical protein